MQIWQSLEQLHAAEVIVFRLKRVLRCDARNQGRGRGPGMLLP